MGFEFKKDDIDRISAIFCAEAKIMGESYFWAIKGYESGKPMIVNLYSGVEIGDGEFGSIISVQTAHGYYELHGVSAFMPFEPDEVIFAAKSGNSVSCLIVGANSTCSLYSNIRKELLQADFSELHEAALLAATQLSIIQDIIE